MINYVMGLVYAPIDILLLHWDNGAFGYQTWNGIGGKVESWEPENWAMARECKEQTGMETQPEDWEHFAYLSGDEVKINFFKIEIEQMSLVKSAGNSFHWVHANHVQKMDVVPHLKWLVPASLDPTTAKPILGKLNDEIL